MTTPAPFEDFWLKRGDDPWHRVSKQEFLWAEQNAGFHGKFPGEPATASFSKTTYPGGQPLTIRGSTFTPLEVEQDEQGS